MYGDQVEGPGRATLERANGANKIPAAPAVFAAETECAARQTARNALLTRAMHLREEARQLEGLARAIPENFPPDAELALWRLAIGAR